MDGRASSRPWLIQSPLPSPLSPKLVEKLHRESLVDSFILNLGDYIHRSTDQRAQSLINLLFSEGSELSFGFRSAASDNQTWFQLGSGILEIEL